MWDIQEAHGSEALNRHLFNNGRYNREIKFIRLWEFLLQGLEAQANILSVLCSPALTRWRWISKTAYALWYDILAHESQQRYGKKYF